MIDASRWWSEIAATDEARVRWLGLFVRPIRARLDTPARATPPPVVAAPAERIEAPPAPILGEPRAIVPTPSCQPGGVLDPRLRSPGGRLRGSIDLSQLLLDEEPAAAAWAA